MEPEVFLIAIGTFMKQLTKSTLGSKVRSGPKQQTDTEGRQQHNPPGRHPTRKPRPRVRGSYGIGKKGRRSKRIILGGVRTRKHYNKLQRIRRTRWDWLLDVKRDAASVAEGVSQMELTTQQLKSAPRKKKSARVYGF